MSAIEPEIKYEGFGGGPLLVGAWDPGPMPPLNPALGEGAYRPFLPGKGFAGAP